MSMRLLGDEFGGCKCGGEDLMGYRCKGRLQR